jgi:hypothetical protein
MGPTGRDIDMDDITMPFGGHFNPNFNPNF